MEPGKRTKKFPFSPVPASLMILVLLLIAVLLSGGCTGAFSGIQDTARATPVSSGTGMNQTPNTCTYVQLTTNREVCPLAKDSCSFMTPGPMEYPRVLRMNPDQQVPARNVQDDGIPLHDAERLMKDIDSREPAVPLVSLLSSYLPFGRTSTVGNAVLFLLDGYRTGKYPPGISSLNYFRSDRNGVRAGWNSFGKQGLPDERDAGRIVQNMPPGRIANQITMQVVMVDETAHPEYTTVWLTPSARIYTLAKNIPDYQTYIGLMKQSKKDGSLLTFTLDTQDSPQGFSIITSVAKGVQPASFSTEEKEVPVAQPVPSPDGVNPAHQITMQVIMVDETAHAEYTTVWLNYSQRIYKLPKNIPDYQTCIGLMEQSRNDGTLLTFTLDTQDSTIITGVVKGERPTASS